MNTITLETKTWGHWILEEHPTINIVTVNIDIVGTFHVDSVVMKRIHYHDNKSYFITGRIIDIDNRYLDVPTDLRLNHCRHHGRFFNVDIITVKHGEPDDTD